MAEPALRTARLRLDPPAADDLAFLLEAMNVPAVVRYLGGEIRSPDEVHEGLRADIAAFREGTYRRWTVRLAADGEPIGRCGLFRVRSIAAPEGLRGADEIGWTFAEQAWGQGYATEAARAVLDYGFKGLGLPVIHSQTSDSNEASTRMMRRLGFTRRPELDYVDPDYPPRDNPTTVWSLQEGHRRG